MSAALGAIWVVRLRHERDRVGAAIARVSVWPMGSGGTSMSDLLRRAHALSAKAEIVWDGTLIDRRLDVVRLAARLTDSEGATLRYLFDVDLEQQRLLPANPRARWLVTAWPPQDLSSAPRSD
ncbi:MAG: hypothetical protein AAB426_04240 [Myxococcota bacterium]